MSMLDGPLLIGGPLLMEWMVLYSDGWSSSDGWCSIDLKETVISKVTRKAWLDYELYEEAQLEVN